MTALFVALVCVYFVLTVTRFAASLAFLRKVAPPPAKGEITIMQPILSGDPALESCLRANLAANKGARFMLLIDEDDAPAREICAGLAAANVQVVVGPPPRVGENPKTAKLARGFALVETPLFGVLDDDTMLPPGGVAAAIGMLARGDLVTALPAYVSEGGLWTRLLAAFVNGAALITYPCAAYLGQQRTINGMFYVGRAEDMRTLGGFDAIRGSLTDDYAMAKLYLDGGKRIVQSAIVHPIRTTVPTFPRYRAIMRRWMVFAIRYVRENRTPFTFGLIGVTTMLPFFLVLIGAALGWVYFAAAIALLAVKALAMSAVQRVFARQRLGFADMALQIVADIVTPLHLIAALIKPRTVQWRSRSIRMQDERITYE